MKPSLIFPAKPSVVECCEPGLVQKSVAIPVRVAVSDSFDDHSKFLTIEQGAVCISVELTAEESFAIAERLVGEPDIYGEGQHG